MNEANGNTQSLESKNVTEKTPENVSATPASATPASATPASATPATVTPASATPEKKIEVILDIQKLCKNYLSGEKVLEILKDLTFQIYTGEILSISGQSGQGKSTLLHLLGLLDSANSGQIFFEKRDLMKLSSHEKSQYRNRIMGFIFQFYHLLPEFNALENVMMPAMIQYGIFDWAANKKNVRKRAEELLEIVGLQDRIKHPPFKLSGGERQRVAIARALMNSPRVIFCDEPTGNLDETNANIIQDYLRKLNKELNQTFVIVTHNPALGRIGTRKFLLRQGHLEKNS